jgi:hypothetical protein
MVLTFNERPARRFLLIVLRPLWVRIRALNPLFRNFLILLLRRFSIDYVLYLVAYLCSKITCLAFGGLVRHYNLI